MPITIGKKTESDYSNPLGLLSDCHRRIEQFLNVLIKVASQARGAALSADQRNGLETALRYFREAAPKHTRDEELVLSSAELGVVGREMAMRRSIDLSALESNLTVLSGADKR